MPELSSWDMISDAGPGEAILAVDFPSIGRPEAGFTDLAENIGTRWSAYSVLQTVPAGGRIDRSTAGSDYIRPWVEQIQADGRRVAAVLGYCAGGVHAAAIAEEVGRWQQPAPKVILFDPQFDAGVLADEMCSQLNRMIDTFASLLSAEQVEDARKKTADLAAAPVGDLFVLADAVTDVLRQAGSAAFDRLGLSEAGRTEAITIFQSFMSYLAVTTLLDVSSTWKASSAVLSAEYVTIAGQDPAKTGIFGHAVTVDASHADLLRSGSAVQQVIELMRNN